ncbi:hypothetical protein ACFY0G_17520 [Streptomyces sp. NPDC001552]|uniref:hypothetical protein n=1 Tax=Streptomyces sp. NPDC001552 TaxID=3364587 RepID=UPI00369E4B9A
MKIPPYLVGIWKAPDDETDTTPALEPPAATAVPAKPDYEPTSPPPPTTPARRPLPVHGQHFGSSRLPAPGTTISLDPQAEPAAGSGPMGEGCPHENLLPLLEPATGNTVGHICAACKAPFGAPVQIPAQPTSPEPAWYSTKAPTSPQPVPADAAPSAPADAPPADGAPAAPAGDPAGNTPVSKEKDGAEEEEKDHLAKRIYRDWTGRPAFRTPANLEPRMSGIDRIRAMNFQHWGLVYNAAALCVGWRMGLLSWVIDTMQEVDVHADAWHDGGPIGCYVSFTGVLWLDWHGRRRFILWAFLTRVPTITGVVGALLYGGTEAVTTF